MRVLPDAAVQSGRTSRVCLVKEKKLAEATYQTVVERHDCGVSCRAAAGRGSSQGWECEWVICRRRRFADCGRGSAVVLKGLPQL